MSINRWYDTKTTWATLAIWEVLAAALNIWTDRFGRAFACISLYLLFMYFYNRLHLKGK